MPFFNGGHIWLILILVAVFFIIGPGKLPELGGAVGRTFKEFKRSSSELRSELHARTDQESPNPTGEPRPVAGKAGG